MPAHPSSQSLNIRIALGAAALAALGGLWVLLAVYGSMSVWVAFADSLAYMAVFSCIGFFYWYAIEYIRSLTANTLVALAVQVLCIGMAFCVMAIAGLCEPRGFAHTLPLHLIYGLLLWVILSGWYGILGGSEQKAEEVAELPAPVSEKVDAIDRISVRKGAEIEIIPVVMLTHIQAYGDYVMIHTEGGRHIKEQTMKFFETSLPANFVRIHRSFIVNTDRIARVELAGKENYTIKLKNGVAIKASVAGYKLLRQKLSL